MINIKKNFFYSANSEHYQDAFLLWIFRNFLSEQDKKSTEKETGIAPFSTFFVLKLLNYKNPKDKEEDEFERDEITKVVVEEQKHDSDIDVIVETKTKGKHLIMIEDKTQSTIHPSSGKNGENYETQLEKYYDLFIRDDNYKELFLTGKVHLFYYKNDYLSDEESSRIEVSNGLCKERFRKAVEDSRTGTKTISVKDIERNYTWEKIDISGIVDIFSKYKTLSNDIVLKQYYECVEFKKTWLDVTSYPASIRGYDELSQYYKNLAWFSYLRNCIYKNVELKKKVENSGGKMNEPYWHQGGNDINIAIFADKDDLPHLRIVTTHLENPDKIVVQVAIYGAEITKGGKTDNSYYEKNKAQIETIKKYIQEKENQNDYSLHLLPKSKKDVNKTSTEEGKKRMQKTIASTDKISIKESKNKDAELIKIIEKCFAQLQEIPKDVRRKRK